MQNDFTKRIDTLEAHVAHLENQYEQLNEVIVAQGRLLSRVQKELAKFSHAMGSMEIERIKANNPKPPHY